MVKKLYLKNILYLIAITFSFSMIAQDDIILRGNGEEMHGKVVKINEDDLQFVYKNESVEYTINQSDIIKITFASGRIEFFNKELITSNFFDKIAFDSNTKLKNYHNRVAVLPFGYIKDHDSTNIVMTRKIQQEAFTIFKNNASLLKFQNPEITNRLLTRAGIKNNNIEGYTMGEICHLLDVEYVIQGLISSKDPAMNYNNTTMLDGNKNYIVDKDILANKDHIVGNIWNNTNETGDENELNVTAQNHSTSISINIFNDKGNNVFSRDHSSFWQTDDAYKVTLTYLAKQTPIYNR